MCLLYEYTVVCICFGQITWPQVNELSHFSLFFGKDAHRPTVYSRVNFFFSIKSKPLHFSTWIGFSFSIDINIFTEISGLFLFYDNFVRVLNGFNFQGIEGRDAFGPTWHPVLQEFSWAEHHRWTRLDHGEDSSQAADHTVNCIKRPLHLSKRLLHRL